MSTTEEHYRQLLAKHYTWMSGSDFAARVRDQRTLLESILQQHHMKASGLALDLGSGPGFQSVALADLGFSPVIAVDTSAELLAELRTHSGAHRIETRQADLAAVGDLTFPSLATVAVCMGDTLSHLPSRQKVQSFFSGLHRVLASSALFVITYRDLTVELHDLDRFLPVRSDEEKIMTCFLEYEQDAVVVHDLIHVREGSEWHLHKSSYRKLRLAKQWVVETLFSAGFRTIQQGDAGRLSLIVAQRS